MDQTELAEAVANSIKFNVLKDVLVKPLDPIMITREFDVPVPSGTAEVEDGVEATEYEEVVKETKEVESAFAKGIVLMTPPYVGETPWPFKAGDTIYYNKRMSAEFDVLKDSRLVKPYDIIAIEKN